MVDCGVGCCLTFSAFCGSGEIPSVDICALKIVLEIAENGTCVAVASALPIQCAQVLLPGSQVLFEYLFKDDDIVNIDQATMPLEPCP